MVYPNLDVSEMFADREAQRSSMHARHLNEQLVKVLKTIGYDVGFQKGQGQYLFDRDGARYLDLLSRIWRICHRPQSSRVARGVEERARRRPAQSGATRRLDARRHSGRASARLRALSRQGVLRQFRRRSRRGRDQVRALRHRPHRHRLLRAFIPRAVLRRAVADRRSAISAPDSSRCCPVAPRSRSTISRRSRRRCRRARSRPSSSSRSRARASTCPATNSCRAPPRCANATAPC